MSSLESTVGGFGSLTDGEGQAGVKTSAVPRPDDEPPLTCKLYGNTISGFVKLCGWSCYNPNQFFNIKPTLKLTEVDEGSLPKHVEELRSRAVSLREMETMVGGMNKVVNKPVYVQVVAKRRATLVPKNNSLLVIPLLVVADSSGYCVLSSFNEGLAVIYSEVDVGDRLLVTKCMPQTPPRTNHRGLFSDQMFLNLELKVHFFSARDHYKWNFNPMKLADFNMPLGLFDSSCLLRLPSEPEPSITSKAHFYDLIGVVTHVGRIERERYGVPKDLDCVDGDSTKPKRIVHYTLYRWISIVDVTSSPFPIKVYINNITAGDQADLVPGAVLILTHCQTKECPFSGEYCATSNFTQLYLEGYAERYLLLHRADSFRETAKYVLAREKYIRIMLRNDITLSIGGTHAAKVLSPDKFAKLFRDAKTPGNDEPFVRRESRRIYFHGLILRALLISDETKSLPIYEHPEKYTMEKYKKDGGRYKVVENFYPSRRCENSSWYAFRRKLPGYNPLSLTKPRRRDIVKCIVEEYKPYCLPLLMPSVTISPDHNPLPQMAGLAKLDGTPYLLLDIVCEESRLWYTCIWKNHDMTVQGLRDRINDAKMKKVMCVADVFCVEPDAPFEVNLLDFVTSD